MPFDSKLLENQKYQLHQDLQSHIKKTLPLREANGFEEKPCRDTMFIVTYLCPGSALCLQLYPFHLEMFGKGAVEKTASRWAPLAIPDRK